MSTIAGAALDVPDHGERQYVGKVQRGVWRPAYHMHMPTMHTICMPTVPTMLCFNQCAGEATLTVLDILTNSPLYILYKRVCECLPEELLQESEGGSDFHQCHK